MPRPSYRRGLIALSLFFLSGVFIHGLTRSDSPEKTPIQDALTENTDNQELRLTIERMEGDLISLRHEVASLTERVETTSDSSVSSFEYLSAESEQASNTFINGRASSVALLETKELPPLGAIGDSDAVAESAVFENQISTAFLDEGLSVLGLQRVDCVAPTCRVSYTLSEEAPSKVKLAEMELLFSLSKVMGSGMTIGARVTNGNLRTFDIDLHDQWQ